MSRLILHCDMNNFYASAECVMHPELRGKPLAVCGDEQDRHGIVLAKNYIAKKYGIKTAETVWSAVRKCPELITVSPHFDSYMRFSELAREIYERYTPLVEPFGLDECWLDVTGKASDEAEAVIMANEIKNTVKRELGLTLSVGVSFNKVFSKLGSDLKKPDAVTLIPREGYLSLIGKLPVSDMLGVGSSTAQQLSAYGIENIRDLAAFSEPILKQLLGKCGEQIWRYANGLDASPVTVRDIEMLDKSAGNGITAPSDITKNEDVWQIVLELAEGIGHRLIKYGKRAEGIAICIKDNTLSVKQWQCPLERPTQSAYTIAKQAFILFEQRYNWNRPIRSVTVRAIGLKDDAVPEQISMLGDEKETVNFKSEYLDGLVEGIRMRFGKSTLKNAAVLGNVNMPRHAIPNTLPGGMGR